VEIGIGKRVFCMKKVLDKAKNISNIVCVGDVHGKTKELGFRIRERYKISDSIIILCGDIGLGFNRQGYHKAEMDNLNRILKKNNNVMFVIRGNHDDPAYFDGRIVCGDWSRIALVSDYTVIENKDRRILCIGGGISVDRTQRTVGRSYWKDEIAVYDEKKLAKAGFVNIVCTHTSPAMCMPRTKIGIEGWLLRDLELEKDVDAERKVFSDVFEYLKVSLPVGHLQHWVYAHFHISYSEQLEGCFFRAIDELEFYQIPLTWIE